MRIVIIFERASRVKQLMLFHRLLNLFVGGNFGQSLLVDCLGGFFLLHNAQNTVVQMLVELLCIAEQDGTGGAFAGGVGAVVCALLGRSVGAALAAVGRSLLDSMDRGQVALEDVGAVETLLGGGAGPRAEAADHCALVVGKSVAVLVIFARKALGVVFAGHNGAFFGALGLVGEHVGFEILEDATAVGEGAAALFLDLVVGFDTAEGGALLGAAGLNGGNGGAAVVDGDRARVRTWHGEGGTGSLEGRALLVDMVVVGDWRGGGRVREEIVGDVGIGSGLLEGDGRGEVGAGVDGLDERGIWNVSAWFHG